ncbi:MAG: hypothetical protein RLP44_17010 [Aggregatilineales bacterium]
MIIEDDPILGKFIAFYPSNRARLLLIAGGILGVVWFVVTVALWEVEAGLASAITVAVISATTLLVGWYVAHLWNREVILFEHGFSYRQGSYNAFIQYSDVRTIRQKAERLSYFGGWVHYTVYKVMLKTSLDEVIVLNNIYRKMDDLSVRIEAAVTIFLRPYVKAQIQEHGSMPFAQSLSVTENGLNSEQRTLDWAQLGGYEVKNGALTIKTGANVSWLTVPLDEVDNIRLLLELLREHMNINPTHSSESAIITEPEEGGTP